MSKESERLPRARKERLVIQELHDEVLVYDLDRHKAHCLNETAARIWRHCDGRSTVKDLAGLFPEKDKSGEGNAEAVWLALEELSQRHLLAEAMMRPPALSSISRREMVQRIGLATAIAVPVITTLVAPRAVQAATCKPANAACTTDAECCSGICTGSPKKCLGA